MKYNVDQLYAQETLDMGEASFLLGKMPIQNIYRLIKTGKVEGTYDKSFRNERIVRNIVTKSLLNYILQRRGKLLAMADKYKLPTNYNED